MNSKDMVTDFKLQENGENCTIKALLKAINAFCGSLAEEYDFGLPFDTPKDARLPEKYWRLIAFAVEGSNEGYYVHLGALVRDRHTTNYVSFSLAKTYSAESAYELAKQTSRFLAAACWN
jgi:hypothetical protein